MTIQDQLIAAAKDSMKSFVITKDPLWAPTVRCNRCRHRVKRKDAFVSKYTAQKRAVYLCYPCGIEGRVVYRWS